MRLSVFFLELTYLIYDENGALLYTGSPRFCMETKE